MIAVERKPVRSQSRWQTRFVAMLPELERQLRRTFRCLDPESREESVREAIAHSLFAYVRLHEQNRAAVASPSTLALYSSRHVKRGRPAAGRMNSKEPLSRYAQLGRGIRVERLDAYSEQREAWIDWLVEDKQASVPDRVAAKMDFGAWFASLTQHMKRVAKDLAFGCSTSEVAQKYGVTSGRISQLRRTLEESWTEFQQEATPSLPR
jgi:hypothetical protein